MLLTLDPNSRKWACEDLAGFSARLQRLAQYVYRQMLKGGTPKDFADRAMNDVWLTGITPLKLWEVVEPRLRTEEQHGVHALPAWWSEGKNN